FFLWAPLLSLGARSLALAAHNPSIWEEVSPFVPRSHGVLWGTLQLCVLTAIAATAMGVPLGICLARGPRWLQFLSAISAALPLGVPPVILAAPFVSARSAADHPLLYAVITLTLSFYPLSALSTGAALLSLPRGEEEAALLLSSPLRAWLGVLGRRIFPAIIGSAGAIGALCVWEMGAPDLLGQPSFGMSVYRALNSPQTLGPGEGAMRAFLASLPVPVLALLFLLPATRAVSLLGSEPQFDGLKSRWAGLGAWVLLASPGFILFELGRALESTSTTWNTIAANDDAVTNTLITATLSAAWLTFAALLLLFTWRHWPRSWRALALGGSLLPGLCAPVVLGVALIEWWNRDAFAWVCDSTLGMVLVGHAARFLPFAIALLWVPVSRLHPDTSFAAQNLGASPLRALFTAEIPLLKGALAATFAVLWALCAGELTITVLVHGPGGDTLPLPIFNLLHAGIAADVASLCLLLMMLCGTAMAMALLVLRPRS
ncbi:iron ABC transporter permease, partial [bacterium]